ncbi:MAG: hypothetical protein QOG84_2149 [Sphingomonadales bacterium]|jgi:hypothetical protein|nr:hypothetical protein [Sphingomonadales bacterium]
MSIAAPSSPPGGLAAVRRAVAARPALGAALEGLRAGPPLPVYRIGRRDALRPRPLRSAKLVSWDYLLVGGGEACIVSMRAERGGLEFGGILRGALVRRMLAAAFVAERELGGRGQDYRAKLIDCPPLRLLLFVAQAGRGPAAIIPLVEGKPGDEEDMPLSWGLRPFLAARAHHGQGPLPGRGPPDRHPVKAAAEAEGH